LFINSTSSQFVMSGDVDITYNFAARKNGSVVLPIHGSVSKKAWERIELLFVERFDTGNVIHTPDHYCILAPFPQADFSILGL